MSVHRQLGSLLLVLGAFGGVAVAGPSTDLDRFALFADAELRAQGAHVSSGDLGANRGLLWVRDPVDAPHSVLAGDDVRISPRSKCDALLFAHTAEGANPACGPGVRYEGPIVADVADGCGFPSVFPACNQGAPVVVGHREVRTLSPGAYGDVIVQGGGAGDGRLVLTGGRYVLCSLRLSRGAELEIDSAASVLVRGDVKFGPGASTRLAADLTARDLSLLVGGGNVALSRGVAVQARLCAPGAALRVESGDLTGSFVANRIHTGRIAAAGLPPASGTTTSTTTSTSHPTSTSTTSTTVVASTSTSTSSTSTSTTSSTTSTVVTTTSTSSTTTTSSTAAGSTSTSSTTVVTSTSTSTSSTVTTTTLAACTPVTGSARTFTVGLDVPEGLVVQGVTILLDYPEAQVTIPGSGAAPSVKQSVTALQAGTLATPNDLDVALRESVASLSGTLAVGPLFRVTFQDCQGATPPAPGDFGCTVESTSDPFGNSVDGVTCDVSSP